MTDTANRVLSLAEVMALEEGARVWVEEHQRSEFESGIGKTHTLIWGEKAVMTPDLEGWYSLTDPFPGGVMGKDYRVWSLPQPPTPEEIEANPWRKEGEA